MYLPHSRLWIRLQFDDIVIANKIQKEKNHQTIITWSWKIEKWTIQGAIPTQRYQQVWRAEKNQWAKHTRQTMATAERLSAAEETIPKNSNKRKHWISNNILELIEKKCQEKQNP